LSRIEVISNGGGVQSTAIFVLIAQGKIPKPDLAVMVDTEYEKTDVLEYQDKYTVPLCEMIGLEYIRVKKSEYTNHDIKQSSEKHTTVLPGFFTTLSGKIGKTPSFCSSKWKQEVFQRYLNDRYEKEISKNGFNVIMGISLDEYRRVKVTEGKWQRKYPLIKLRLTRQDCILIVEKFGIPKPIRSACWMCPNKSDLEWQLLTEHDLNKAIAFEKKLQKEFPYYHLHSKCLPLEGKPFLKEGPQMEFGFCDSGMCFV